MDIVGGCCGTTPEHIAKIVEKVEEQAARAIARVPATCAATRPSSAGSRPDQGSRTPNFLMVGERTNVTGSARFRKLITANDYEAALEVALEQVRGGANVLDVNMDEGMLDSEACMTTFLNLIATEPEISRIPIMIDSSKWSVIEAGLRCLQGKGIVNSISPQGGRGGLPGEGPRRSSASARASWSWPSTRRARPTDEDRKVEICKRAYDLLTERGRLPPRTSSSTPTSSPSAPASRSTPTTRSPSSRRPADQGGLPRRQGLRRRQQPVVQLPRQQRRCARRSTRPSSTTPSKAGMDMGIVNAGMIQVYEDIPEDLLERVEDLIFNRPRRHRAADRVRGDALRRRQEARGGPLLARGTAWRSASPTPSSTASSTSSTRTPRRRARATTAPST